jgi:hypothetical protein
LSVGAEIGGGAANPPPVPVDDVELPVSCTTGLARGSGVENDRLSLGNVVICHPSLLMVALVRGNVGAGSMAAATETASQKLAVQPAHKPGWHFLR